MSVKNVNIQLVVPPFRLFPLEPATYSSPDFLERYLSQLAETQPKVMGIVRHQDAKKQLLYAVLIQDPGLDDEAISRSTAPREREVLEHLAGCRGRVTLEDIAGSDARNVATVITPRMFDTPYSMLIRDDMPLAVLGIMPEDDKRHYAIFCLYECV